MGGFTVFLTGAVQSPLESDKYSQGVGEVRRMTVGSVTSHQNNGHTSVRSQVPQGRRTPEHLSESILDGASTVSQSGKAVRRDSRRRDRNSEDSKPTSISTFYRCNSRLGSGEAAC